MRVDYLSRARTAAQTKALLKDLAEGNIDILVGTHKLIGKTVKFKDLGLLIIDEEQKFGVSVKERSANSRSMSTRSPCPPRPFRAPSNSR